MSKKVDTYLFDDRQDAVNRLLSVMPVDEFKSRDTAVVALSSGGALVAQEVASRLDADLHVLLSENIYAPKNRELVIAKVSETQDVLVHHAFVDSLTLTSHGYTLKQQDYIRKKSSRIKRFAEMLASLNL